MFSCRVLMQTKFNRRRAVAGSLLVVLLLTMGVSETPAQAATTPSEVHGVRASYRGRVINLAEDWEGAMACVVSDESAACFDTAEERDGELAKVEASTDSVGVQAVSCASSVRLYDGTSYMGASVAYSTRGAWLNLSSVGFDNRTSSFRIGACSSYFADDPGGGGSWYPTSATQAGAQSTSMVSGWNNRVSSIYLT